MKRKLPCDNLSMLWGVRVLFPHCDLNPQLFATSQEPIDRALLLNLFRNKRTEVTLLLAKLNDCIIAPITASLLFRNPSDEIKHSGNSLWCSITLCFIVGKRYQLI